MALPNEKRPCSKCKTANGVAMCDGCQESFCTNHFFEHRQALSAEMDNIGQNYDLLRRDLSKETKEHPLMAHVNAWEQESVNKIRKAAETARANLQKLLDQIKIDLESSVAKMIGEIKTSRDSDDFTENEFKRWIEQLNELRQGFESPSNIHVENDDPKETVIDLIKICDQQQSTPSASISVVENHFLHSQKSNIFNDEKFDSKTDAILSGNNLIATCCSKYRSPGAIAYGFNSYSSGLHDVSFRIEKKGLSRLFFGVYSSLKKRVDAISSDSENSVYGWWDIDSVVLNGTRQESGHEHIILTGDKIVLTLDCDQQQIQLYHVRENQQVQLPIDLNKCPFPWKIVIKLTSNGDCVRIL